MTLFIDVGHVLRGSVCELYSNLLTRPTGAAVCDQVGELEQRPQANDVPGDFDLHPVSLSHRFT